MKRAATAIAAICQRVLTRATGTHVNRIRLSTTPRGRRPLFLATILLAIISGHAAQAQTNPAAQALPFSLTSQTGSTLPAGVAVHRFGTTAGAIPTTRTTTPGNADLPYSNISNAGGWRDEGVNGIGILASGAQAAGALVVAIDTTGKTNVQVSWVARTILQQASRDNSIALQYRLGTAGNFIDVDPSVYTSAGKTAGDSATFTNVTLPAAAENQPVVQVRWIYWESVSTSGSRDRIAVDDISITANSGPIVEPTVQASNVVFSNVAATSLTVSWTNGNGTARLVLAKQGSPVDAAPADGTAYNANPSFGSGSELSSTNAPATSTLKGAVVSVSTTTAAPTLKSRAAAAGSKLRSVLTTAVLTIQKRGTISTPTQSTPTVAAAGGGNFVVHAGAGNSVTVTNLQPNTTYHFAVFEFNGSGVTADYLTTNPATGSQTTAAAFQISGVVRGAGGNGLSGVAVTLSDDDTALANTVTDANGNYSFTNVAAGGDYTVTPSSASFTFSPTSASFNGLASNQTADFTGTPRVIISEFRFRGPDPDGAGAGTASANEFVELYNQTDEAVTVTGWTLRASTSATLLTLPTAQIPARGHYLVAGAGYGLAASASADSTLAADIPDGAGVALFNSSTTFDASTRLDAAGFAGVGDAIYREGAGLTPTGGVTADAEFVFVRRLKTGTPADTDDNENDFQFLSTAGEVYDSRQSLLGAPGPENVSSPVQRNSQMASALLDPAVASSVAPNRVRDFSSNPSNNSTFGTMSIRRTMTNLTGANITRLRFRIVDVTAHPTPPGFADLRALTSGQISVTVTGGATKTVQGTTLEQPPAQANGGALNSTLAAGTVTLAQPLANGQSIDLQFLLGVQQAGTFRFFINIEAVTQAPASASVHLTMGNPSNATADTNQPTNYLMEKPQYALAYHRDRGTPIWTSWHLDSSWLGSTPRQDDFRADTTLPAGWYQVQGTDFSGSGFDRGHMTPSADRTKTVADNSATFLMTNMIPQAPDNNQGPWAAMENYLRTLVGAGNELYIISGGSGVGGSGSAGGTTNTIASGHVTVPSQTWKVIIVIPSGTDDVNRVTNATRTIAVIMPNTQGIRNVDWKTYRVSVDQVEALTGFDFFSNVPVGTQAVIESVVDNQ
jgi:endonuclease G, mitochondrial